MSDTAQSTDTDEEPAKGARSKSEAKMTKTDMEEFLAAPRMAAFGTLRKDGRPYIDPVGYVYLDDALYVSIDGSRDLLKRLRNNQAVFVSVFDEAAPASAAVQMEGTIEFVDDPDHEISLQIVRRYAAVGDELPNYEARWVKGYADAGRQLVRLVPTRMFGWDGKKTAAYRRRHEQASA